VNTYRRGLLAAGVGLVGLALGLLWARPGPDLGPPRSALVTVSDPGERGPAPQAPHLVLVIGCTVRRDQTSLHGGPAHATPFLAELARQGAHLDDLVTAAPWTRAAGTALLTGRHPLAVGMADPALGRDERSLPRELVTLAEHLRSQGYTTLGMTTNPNLGSFYGFEQGFDGYRQLARLWREDGTKLPGRRAVTELLALLDAHPGGGPYYLQLVLIDAHAPHVADEADRTRFADPSVPDRVVAYRASLARMDRALASLDEGLRARGLGPDNTLLVFVNDHGDGLSWPEHHGASHGRFLAPSSVGGVLVARGPGIPAGHLVPGVASQLDVAPTLVSLLGLPPFPGGGHDLAPALRGEAPGTGRTRAFTDTWFKEVSRAAVYTDTTACQLDAGEPTGDGFAQGCFDRRADPQHVRPFRDEGLEEELGRWRQGQREEGERFSGEGKKPEEGVREQLEALGYLD
jgi:arylsulfatase A-like enzyme